MDRLPNKMQTIMTNREYDIAIISIGPGSFSRRVARGVAAGKYVGVITFPIYNIKELLSAGIRVLIGSLPHTYVHITGIFTSRLVARFCNRKLDCIITESQRNALRLQSLGVKRSRIEIVLPGVDPQFISRTRIVEPSMEMHKSNLIFLGSSMPLRGIEDLVGVMRELAMEGLPLRLRILLRRDTGTDTSAMRLIRSVEGLEYISIEDESLDREEIIREILKNDIVVFPFRLVPSEMPISPLEAISLGRTVIVPDLNGLGDLEAFGALCYSPGSTRDLKKQIRITAENDSMNQESSYERSPNSWEQSAIEFENILLALLMEDEL